MYLGNNTPTRTRKRQKRPELWHRSTIKKLRESGKQYTDRGGNVKSPKKMKPGCKDTCFYLCSKYFSENNRLSIFNSFWSLSDEGKNQFYLKFVKRELIKRSRTSSEIKKFSFKFYFEVDGEIRRVCREFFLNTLSIDKKRVYYCFNKLRDPRGTPTTRKKGKFVKKSTPVEKLEEIRDHIKSFPVIDSHYCRSSSDKKYLPPELNLTKMYNYYVEKTSEPLKIHMYRKIFNYEFNMAFLQPKKDLCNKCFLFKNNRTPTEKDRDNYKNHTMEKNMSKAERDLDRSNIDANQCIVCYDLQNVFSLPKGNSSIFFYKRKLNVFNLTATAIIPQKEKITYCAIWHEGHSGRSGNDIASALLKLLNNISKDNPNLKKIILWSDSCVPQNKNKINSAGIKYFLENSSSVVEIVQKYSEPGHSNIQEVDAVHSVIDRYLKKLDIHSPLHLLKLLKNVNTSKTKLKIFQMQESDFLSLSSISSKLNFIHLPFTKVKCIKYEKSNPFSIQFKNSFSEINFKTVNLKSKSNLPTTFNILRKPPPVLSQKSIISGEKKNDLKSLIPYLPQIDQQYFTAILNLN